MRRSLPARGSWYGHQLNSNSPARCLLALRPNYIAKFAGTIVKMWLLGFVLLTAAIPVHASLNRVDRNYPSQVNAAGSITQLVHDAVWNLTQITDPNGNPTTHQVDALDRLVSTVDAIGGITGQEFDGGGNLAGVTTPNNATTTYDVDDLGNVLKETSPDRGVIAYTHDGNGNVLTRTDARGATATFTYDALNRVTSVFYPNSSENITFTYDACAGGIGRLCSVADATGTRSWSYDGFGRVVSETWVQGGTSKTTSYTWTLGDDLASITLPSGRTVAYTRDAIGRVTTVASNSSNIFTGRVYRADGLRTAQTWGNGINETRTNDLQGRLTGWQVGAMLNRTFAYDANGNVVQKDLNQFQYDPLDRLTWEPTQALSYDGNGNRLLDATGAYSYTPASNRMATGPPGGITLDAAGNTLQLGGMAFAYNQAGRLVSATAGGQTATYTYRFDGLRSSKTVGGTTTFFHYDLDGRLIAESDAGTGVTLREYVWDEAVPVAQIQAGVTTYLHTDHLGTPLLGTNSAGTQVWAWDSDAFGTTQPTGSVTVNLRFPGQYSDAETGLHQNWNRTFDPLSGRYLESDPIGLAGGGNTFGYVGGNPLRYTDREGLAIDVLADVGFIFYDLYRIGQDNVFGSCGNLKTNLTALGADVIGAAIPGVTGLGMTVRAAGPAKRAMWTSTKSQSVAENAFRHFKDHGADFGAKNAVDYVRTAQDFLRNPSAGVLSKIRANGDVVRFDPSTNAFGVIDKTGAPRTFFKPDPAKHGYPTNLEYFHAQ